MFYGARYLMLFLSIFSLYCGVIYNDIFSLSFKCMPSGWKIPKINKSSQALHYSMVLDPALYMKSDPYPMGIDPLWHLSTNKLNFINAMKMKMSIVIGVFHMLFGLFLSVVNHVHFNKRINIVLEFIPSFLYIVCSFGYLTFLIFYKWIMVDAKSKSHPSLMGILINMFMNPVEIVPEEKQFFAHQGQIEKILLTLFLASIPWMLLGKPLYMYATTTTRRSSQPNRLSTSSDDEAILSNVDSSDDHLPRQTERGLVDTIIEQFIHVIEFCLGTFSHTASYLRLWALSLAHTALSDVLWDMVIKRIFFAKFGPSGVISCVILSGFWLVITTVVLVGMEGLSAFLHALRLHWVEFQSKFFYGDGYPFQAFTLDFED